MNYLKNLIKNRKKGSSLLIVIMIFFSVFVLSFASGYLVFLNIYKSSNLSGDIKAYYAALAGVERAQFETIKEKVNLIDVCSSNLYPQDLENGSSFFINCVEGVDRVDFYAVGSYKKNKVALKIDCVNINDECSSKCRTGSLCGGGKLIRTSGVDLIVSPSSCNENGENCDNSFNEIDYSQFSWDDNEPEEFIFYNATNRDDGLFNTSILDPDNNTNLQAVKYCYDANFNDFSDWYLPASNEFLSLTSTQLVDFFGFSDEFDGYWVSTEEDENNANLFTFGEGVITNIGKETSLPVRCIRQVNLSNRLQVNPDIMPDGYAGADYSYNFTASGGVPPYTFSTESPMPEGLSLSEEGLFSGNPLATGDYQFLIKVDDSDENSATRYFSLSVLSSDFSCGDSLVYNDITYGSVLAGDERCWLDRNLGASQLAETYDDYFAYGNLYQWGRLSDGHETISWGGSENGEVSETIGELSETDDPGHSYFIRNSEPNYDWHLYGNNDLWQGVSGTNNPCPPNFRLPTFEEWIAVLDREGVTQTSEISRSSLKLTFSGYRSSADDGKLTNAGRGGFYWSSSISDSDATGFYFDDSTFDTRYNMPRSNAGSVRCILENR